MTRALLAIETSCDETAAAVVDDSLAVRSSVVASQIDLHATFGGVVPELASRAHVETITPIVERALDEAGVAGNDLDAVAVTSGPGLVGALLVGIATAKALALGWGVPVVGVNHLEGHLASVYLADRDVPFPQIALLVSGGHCMLTRATEPGRNELLGETVDDSIGEAYDKVARFLGLGYPGGPVLDQLAAAGEDVLGFPRPMLADGYAFSFSGLKTAVVNYVRANPAFSETEVAASFVAACMDVLCAKLRRALEEYRRSRRRHRGRRGRQSHSPRPGAGTGRRLRRQAAHPTAFDGHRQRRHDRRGGLARLGLVRAQPARLRTQARPAVALHLVLVDGAAFPAARPGSEGVGGQVEQHAERHDDPPERVDSPPRRIDERVRRASYTAGR